MESGAHSTLLARGARLAHCAVWISLCWAAVPASALETAPDQTPWVPVRALTRDGSSFRALARASASAFRDEGGKTTPVEWARVRTLTLAERPSRALEEQAAQAVPELGDENYLTREKARLRLKALGRAAEGALRQAATSPDPEVASKARQLLADAAGLEQGPSLDQLLLDDGRVLNGTLEGPGVELQTRWGFIRFGADALEKLEAADGAAGVSPPAGGAPPAQASCPAPSPLRPAERYHLAGAPAPGLNMLLDPEGPEASRLGFETHPLTHEPLRPGESVEDLYADRGVLLRAADQRQRVVAADIQGRGDLNGRFAAAVNEPPARGDVEFSFVVPGSFDPRARSGRPAGVRTFSCRVGGAVPGGVGLAAYDRSGRKLLQVLNTIEEGRDGKPLEDTNWLGVRCVVPIVRARLFRATENMERLHLDDVGFSQPLPADRDLSASLVELRGGERLAGQIVSGGEGLTLLPGFFPLTTPPVPLRLDEIVRYEPPWMRSERAAEDGPSQAPHAVWLQEGSALRAQFMNLDQKEVQLALPGGVALALPRAMLRKVDFFPEPAAGVAPVADSEKPGVEFRSRAAPPPPVPPAGAAKGPPAARAFAPGLPRMDNAEVLSADYGSGELSVDPKDGAGAWQIDLRSVRALVFPRAQPAQPAGGRTAEPSRAPEWTLTLRHGGRFNVKAVSIAPELVSVELGGIPLKFPNAVVSSLERRGEAK